MAVTIIADDLTGACDAGALFAGRGPVGVFITPELPDARWPAAAVDCESRALPPADAAERVRRAARGLERRLTGGRLFKKIDSTFRGPVAAELDALLDAAGATIALVCPAFPAQGRTVCDGVLTVHGLPAHQSSTGSDPDYPGASSDLVEILSRHARRAVSLLPLKEVRGPIEDLVRTLAGRDGVVVADVEVDRDLDALARAAVRREGLLLAGSAGLAGAAARAWGYSAPAPALPRPGAWLIVAGSRHPATRAQLFALEASGATGARIGGARGADLANVVAALRAGRPAFVASDDAAHGTREDMATRLATAMKRVLAEASPALVVLTGGETARAVLRALGARHLELVGAPASGLALGRLVVHETFSLPVLTKAGGFGPPELFVALAKGAA
jgi:D-threonate/D-erythronate kinase